MEEHSRGWLFRKRNILGAALAAGIGLGLYLGQLGFDFGFGRSGTGEGTSTGIQENQPGVAPIVVRVEIDEHQFFLQEGTSRKPIELAELIDLIQRTPGDADGVRVRIYQKLTARASAEEALKKALADAKIPDTAIFWVPPAQNQ